MTALVVLGGLPGAGKSTALRQLAATPGVRARVLDSAAVRERLQPHLRRVPYAAWRPLVHAVSYARLAALLLRGPRAAAPLVVHDTATRRWVRVLLARAARRRGWRPVLVFLDVDPSVALAGQQLRGRRLRSAAFARHVARVAGHGPDGLPARWAAEGWSAALRTTRAEAAAAVARAVLPPALPRPRATGDGGAVSAAASAAPRRAARPPR